MASVAEHEQQLTIGIQNDGREATTTSVGILEPVAVELQSVRDWESTPVGTEHVEAGCEAGAADVADPVQGTDKARSIAQTDMSEAGEVQGIAGLVTATFALGQIAGPLLGTNLTAVVGFEAACAVMATLLVLLVALIAGCSGARTRAPRHNAQHVQLATELPTEPASRRESRISS